MDNAEEDVVEFESDLVAQFVRVSLSVLSSDPLLGLSTCMPFLVAETSQLDPSRCDLRQTQLGHVITRLLLTPFTPR
jgi:hypothetical protein